MAPATYEPTFYLLKHRLPASESTNLLGRIIRRYQDPTLDYTPESPSTTLPSFPTFLLPAQHADHARLTAQTTHSTSAHFKFLTSFSTTSSTTGTTTVTPPRITTRRLKREADYFAALKAVPEVRRKVLDMCPVSDKVYLVVGTMSVQAGTFSSTSLTQRGRGGGVEVPLALAAGAAALGVGVPLPGGLLGEVLPEVDVGVERAGEHFGAGDEDSDEEWSDGEEELGEEQEAVLAQGLYLEDESGDAFAGVEGCVVLSDDGKIFQVAETTKDWRNNFA
ncbi:hypothetical protein NEMBOFW57_010860 [Staphylotrichum longicolle]|uniref:Uncharacterized protein n=1 Tax=Staphylotrichum longicolle TaxID=669026 RepID=A0AAD4ENT9_9PEZI|nr:hypothetical protein NEMBOFW57_010860 [Staphylotrichum longicolle]